MTTQDGLTTGQMVALATAGLALVGLGSWALGKEEKSPASMGSSDDLCATVYGVDVPAHTKVGGLTFREWCTSAGYHNPIHGSAGHHDASMAWLGSEEPTSSYHKMLGGYASKPRLGSGKRFAQLEHKLAERGAHDPKALAAWIGREHLGKAKFQELARKGKARRAKGAMASSWEDVPVAQRAADPRGPDLYYDAPWGEMDVYEEAGVYVQPAERMGELSWADEKYVRNTLKANGAPTVDIDLAVSPKQWWHGLYSDTIKHRTLRFFNQQFRDRHGVDFW